MTGRGFPLDWVLAAAGAGIWALSNPVGAAAAPIRIECPRTLPPDVMAMRERPDGWTQAVPATPVGYPLDGRGVLTGAPDEQAHLKPDRPGAKPNSEKWSFYTPHGYQHWVYCQYGPVVLARRIPASVKECVATKAKNAGQTIFVCK